MIKNKFNIYTHREEHCSEMFFILIVVMLPLDMNSNSMWKRKKIIENYRDLLNQLNRYIFADKK